MLYAVLPILILYLIQKVEFIKTRSENDQCDRFRLLSIAVCLWAVLLIAVTESLSVFKAINRPLLLIVWVFINISLFFYLRWNLRKTGLKITCLWLDEIDRIKNIRNEALSYKCAVGLIVLTFLSVMVLDLITVPYNWDSMTYHLPRIMFWAQNHSVAHYYTFDLRQLSSPYLSEFVNLNQYVLLQSDLFFNFIQGISFCFCAVGVYSIAKKLGLDRKWRLLAVVIMLSTPIVYSEALTTQVDVFTSVWMVIFAYFWLDLLAFERIGLDRVVLTDVAVMGCCVGLAYVTKPSVCISMAIFLLVMAIRMLFKKNDLRIMIVLCVIATLVVSVIVAPGIIRNLICFHAVSSKNVGSRQLVGTIDPRYLIVNFVKNLCFTLPAAWIRKSDKIFYTIPFIIAKIFKINLDDALISEDGTPYSVANIEDFGHDTAGNSLLVWLVILSAIAGVIHFIFFENKAKKKRIDLYSLCSVVSFVVFLFAVRWEPFETRYEVSYLIILCPFVATIASKLTLKSRDMQTAIISVIICACVINIGNLIIYHTITWYTKAKSRPSGYFGANNIYDQWKTITDQVNNAGYKTLGFHSDNGHYSYPVWQMCNDIDRIENVFDGENETSMYRDYTFQPDAIIWLGEKDFSDGYEWNDKHYQVVYSDDDYTLLDRE